MTQQHDDNPHRHLYWQPWSDEFRRAVYTSPPVDELMADLVDPAWEGLRDLAAGRPAGGTIVPKHIGLRGPPGRLHGGLHLVVRTLAIVDKVPSGRRRDFPLKIDARIGKGITMGEPAPFRAAYKEDENGWEFSSRFLDTERLDAAARSLPEGPLLPDEERLRWKERYERATSSGKPTQQGKLDIAYHGNEDICWIDTAEGRLEDPMSPLRRFVVNEGFFSLALMTYQLDNVGAASRALEIGNPNFTTRLELSFAQRYVPVTERVLFLADRASRKPVESGAKPVTINGKLEGTERGEVVMASADFSKIYCRGFLESHPIDLKKLMAGAKRS